MHIFVHRMYKKTNQLHAVSRTQQGRQRKPSTRTLRASVYAKFQGHCVLSGGTQRRTLPDLERRNENINLNNILFHFFNFNKYFIFSSGGTEVS